MKTAALFAGADANCDGPSVAPNIIERVYNFNRIGQVTPPNGWNTDRATFYTGMMCEEFSEKLIAIADGEVEPQARERIRDVAFALKRLGDEFKAGRHMGAILRADRKELLDADIDVLVVTIGSMLYQTRYFREAVAEVLRANDDKFPNGVAIRDPQTNKILKPEGWRGPDLDPFVEYPIE